MLNVKSCLLSLYYLFLADVKCICFVAKRCHNATKEVTGYVMRKMFRVIEYFAKSHSRSLKVIRIDTLDYGVCKSLLVFHRNYIFISYRF